MKIGIFLLMGMSLMFDMYAIMINDVKIILKRLGLPTKGTVDSGEELDNLLDKFENLKNFVPQLDKCRRHKLRLYDDQFEQEIEDELEQ